MTITGVNLGRHYSDVEKAVQVANVPCEVVQEEYVPSQKIVCITGKSTIKGSNQRGVVAVCSFFLFLEIKKKIYFIKKIIFFSFTTEQSLAIKF